MTNDPTRFVRAATAESPLEVEQYLSTLEEAGIKALSVARGQEASDSLSRVGRAWWEIHVAREDSERALPLLEAARARIEDLAAAGEQAALEEYAGEAGDPAAEAASGAPAPTAVPAEEGDRPANLTLAGWLHFGVLGLLAVFRLTPGVRLLSSHGTEGMPSFFGTALWVTFTVAIGYALVWGPTRPRFWRRVRTVAMLRLSVSLVYALVLAVDVPRNVPLAIAEVLVLAALYTPNRKIIRRGIAVLFALDALAVVGWPETPPTFPTRPSTSVGSQTAPSPLPGGRTRAPEPKPSPPAYVADPEGARKTLLGEWRESQTRTSLSLCDDGRYIESVAGPKRRAGSWAAEGDSRCGSLVLTPQGGRPDRRRFCVAGRSTGGLALEFEGTVWVSDPALSECKPPVPAGHER